ncbi:MAG: DNA polymerase II large subunit [Candidatus Altiarchaeota archaeon]|nr:DNA polymerase II large subunit [Candidatus Altiarchaeota archaeon]
MIDRENELYFGDMKLRIEEEYAIARSVRAMNLDPSNEVDAIPAGDLAARVEGLVGPKGIAVKIRSIGKGNIREIIDSILDVRPSLRVDEMEAQIDQALRTSLAILTEGVVAAPIEGISHVKIKDNPDNSKYLSVYFSGPIRSAGGSAQGQAVLCADYIRRRFGLQGYRPTDDEVERYVEEIKIYHERAARLQYQPSDNDIRTIVRNMNVCVDGDPTEEIEVSLHRDLARVETNRVRGGMCLVIAEGVAQKARKILRFSEKLTVDASWLDTLGKEKRADDDSKTLKKFMEEIVGGRPIFSSPSAKGGFRLRYGRSRSCGIMAKAIHPAVMVLLNDFIAAGTQVKVEYPGKGCVITPCETIEPPVVKLKDGSVLSVGTVEQAKEIMADVAEILFLGDILVPYNDFLQTNTPLLPAGYCEECWLKDAKAAGLAFTKLEADGVTAKQAVELSLEKGIPLHPKHTHYWSDINVGELKKLAGWLAVGRLEETTLTIPDTDREAKRVLELIGAPHSVFGDAVIVKDAMTVLMPLGLQEASIGKAMFDSAAGELSDEEPALSLIEKTSPITIRNKSGTYIGCRMGRPEKAKERRMQPAVHALFPVGEAGGRLRSVNEAAQENSITVESSKFLCPRCGEKSIRPLCPACGEKATPLKFCTCGWSGNSERCRKCGNPSKNYAKQDINIRELWLKAVGNVGRTADVKGVLGMISEYKIPEPLEKGLLRAIHDVYVFKDGTIRFDATNVPLTHFKPCEIGTNIETLKKLGYTRDHNGIELTDENQVVEMRVQDVVIPEAGGEYLVKVSQFIDDLLAKLYKTKHNYDITEKGQLVGTLIMGLAPHTSAGVIGRIIGFTKAHVCFAHPYWHAAKRRDADGDEDAFMLLLDGLINFSRKYLPETRGGQMDAPLVVITKLDPKEVDDEAHKMEIVREYPDDFYAKTWAGVNPSEAKVKIVRDVLDDNPYMDLEYTHESESVEGPVLQSRYTTLKTMKEKVDAQLHVAEQIRAVNEREVAELVLNAHFLKDTYGNLRTFTRQHFRCVKCNESYRRVPLNGKCGKCGGKLILTVSEGNIRKYIEVSKDIAEKYHLSDYIKQRLRLIEKELESLFTNDLNKQSSLAEYM